MISIKIDVQKIDKSRLFKGKQGTYLNCTLIETPQSEYGDYMIVEETTKEERDAGKKGTILGNGKVIGKKSAEPPAGIYEKQGKYDTPPARLDEQGDDGMPF